MLLTHKQCKQGASHCIGVHADRAVRCACTPPPLSADHACSLRPVRPGKNRGAQKQREQRSPQRVQQPSDSQPDVEHAELDTPHDVAPADYEHDLGDEGAEPDVYMTGDEDYADSDFEGHDGYRKGGAAHFAERCRVICDSACLATNFIVSTRVGASLAAATIDTTPDQPVLRLQPVLGHAASRSHA